MDAVEFAEKICGQKLFESQKELLRECEKRKSLYITIPPYHGRTYLKCLSFVTRSIFEKGELQ